MIVSVEEGDMIDQGLETVLTKSIITKVTKETNTKLASQLITALDRVYPEKNGKPTDRDLLRLFLGQGPIHKSLNCPYKLEYCYNVGKYSFELAKKYLKLRGYSEVLLIPIEKNLGLDI